MRKSVLLDKSKENEEATELLDSERKYNAATSRLYYSIYQKMIHLLKINNKSITRIHGRNITILHHILLSNASHFHPSVSNQEIKTAILNIRRLKEFRKDCDYGEDIAMDRQKYENEVKALAPNINNILNHYNQQRSF